MRKVQTLQQALLKLLHSHKKKKNPNLYFIPYTNNFKWHIEQNVRRLTTRLIEENIGENIGDTILGKDFLEHKL